MPKGINLNILPFGSLQEAIAKSCKEEYRTLLFRHYMIKAADQLVHRVKADALCMGDALSQVSSQAMRNIAVLDRSTVRPNFSPLIGFNKVEVIELAKKIGTHDISVIPQDDACSLLVPRDPITKPYFPYWTYFTETFNFDNEINQALDNAEVVAIPVGG